jgi:hypothetical protein
MTQQQFQQTVTQQEHQEWLQDHQAQQDYKQWRAIEEIKQANLPDPFIKSFIEIFGEKP